VHFGGLNLDLYSTDRMLIQTTVLRAWNVTDGFNSLVVMPADPVTGNPAPGPAVVRFTPTANRRYRSCRGAGGADRQPRQMVWIDGRNGRTPRR
jgi:hypothetical protein